MYAICFPSGVIERWELIQAQTLSEKHKHKQNLQQWQQLISDLQTMLGWLGQSEAELGQLRGLDLSTDIHTIQQRIKKLKVSFLCVRFSCSVGAARVSPTMSREKCTLQNVESFVGQNLKAAEESGLLWKLSWLHLEIGAICFAAWASGHPWLELF